MLSCQDASRLNSQSQDRRLTRRERMGLSLHLLICKGCREFARHLQTLRAACQQLDKAAAFHALQPALSSAAKTRILSQLVQKRND